MKTEGKQAAIDYIESMKTEIDTFFNQFSSKDYEEAINLIETARKHGNRIHVTGIGKPGHISGYTASLFSSIGVPTYFLHGTEAVHGSCGQLVEGDVVVCISNSGETEEMKATVLAVLENGCKILGISGNKNSWLSKHSDVHLYAGVSMEGGPLDKAPRNSILIEIVSIQILSVILQADIGLTPEQYVRYHPEGSLGKMCKNEITVNERNAGRKPIMVEDDMKNIQMMRGEGCTIQQIADKYKTSCQTIYKYLKLAKEMEQEIKDHTGLPAPI